MKKHNQEGRDKYVRVRELCVIGNANNESWIGFTRVTENLKSVL